MGGFSKREKILLGVLCALLPVSGLLVLWARSFPDQLEAVYSLGFYPAWAGFLSTLTGWIPFSLAEFCVILAAALSVWVVVSYIIKMRRGKGKRRQISAKYGLRILAAVSAVCFMFTIGGGLNYYRYTFTRYSGLEVEESEIIVLRDLCAELAQQANLLREGLGEDENGVFKFEDGSTKALAATARENYTALASENPQWEELFRVSVNARAKGVVFSEAMSYMQIVGFFFPYTMEANINTHTTSVDIPFTICHELSHLNGFMREDEANYLAYLVCMAGDSREFAYSGTFQALIHAGNALYGKNTDMHREVMESLSDAVRRDMAADSEYYYAHKSSFGDFSRSVNDVYLQVNNQSDGVASYGRMVDLLLAEYKGREQLTENS